MVIIAYYLSKDNMVERIILDLLEVEGSYKGNNLASYLLKTLEDWNIQNKLGQIVIDNATNNNSIMQKLSLGKLYSLDYYESTLANTSSRPS